MILERIDEPRDFIFFPSQTAKANEIRPLLELETDLVITSHTRHGEVDGPVTWLTIEDQHAFTVEGNFATQRHLQSTSTYL
jgi:hypothetical protein